MNTARLLDWYRRAHRAMPWRAEVSPYRTLVSELMLQQTRVETVIPYFERFMVSFPTVDALAAAPLERVLEHWSGLGYYSRARNLHAAAQAVVAGGGFPTTLEGLLQLPGVGPYTAGAVGSIALGLDVPVVDGNVERVLCRVDARAEDPKKIKKELWARATALLPAGHAGDFNQALMELGATVCTPTSPRCLICPIRDDCKGRGDPERYPAKAEAKAVPEATASAALIAQDGQMLLARRPMTGLLAGLWEPPGGMGTDIGEILARRLDISVVRAEPVGTVLHVFTHLRLTTTVYRAEVQGEPRPSDYLDARWVPQASVDTMALSTLARKILQAGSAPATTARTRPGRRGRGSPS